MLLVLANSEPTLARDDFSIVMGKQERAKDKRNVLVLLTCDSQAELCCIRPAKRK